MKKIVVTFRVEAEQKKLINSLINNQAKIIYLKDYDENNYQEALKDADLMLAWNPTRELKSQKIDSLANLKFVQLLSAGFDHVNLNMFPAGCKLASNKGAYAEPMAEHILAMVLSLSKKLYLNHKKLEKGEFNQRGINISIKNSLFGILGYGEIGKAAAKLIKSFGSKIYAINSTGKTEDKVDFIGSLKDLEYVLKNSDIVIISLPLNKETNDLIGKKEFEMMKPNAIIINVARGNIINEKALYEHLKNNFEFYAGIDAWWTEPFTEGGFKLGYPFFELPNILGSPHNSALVPNSLQEGLRKAVENLLFYLTEEKAKHIVN